MAILADSAKCYHVVLSKTLSAMGDDPSGSMNGLVSKTGLLTVLMCLGCIWGKGRKAEIANLPWIVHIALVVLYYCSATTWHDVVRCTLSVCRVQ